MLVRYAPLSTPGISTLVVSVENCPSCWGQMDLNADGLLDSSDIDLMIAAMGTDSADADLDSSGLVDADDLRMLLVAITSPESTP